LMLAFIPREVSMSIAVVQASAILMTTGYCAWAGMLAERERRSRREALRESRIRAESRANDVATLNRIIGTVSAQTDLDDVLDAITREMVGLVRATSSAIALLDDGRLRIAAFHSTDAALPSVKGVEFAADSNAASVRVISTRLPLVVADAQNDPLTDPLHDQLRRLGTTCLLLVPLVSRGEVIGTLGIDATEPGRVFTAEEVALAQTVAGHIASMVANARLYD